MIYDIEVLNNKDELIKLDKYKGKVLLIVNTATGCGFTPQYEGIEALYEKYHDQGLEVLDFPCNQFAEQAKGSDEEINTFCKMHYNTTFDRFKKCDVNGPNEVPLFTFLKEKRGLGEIKGLKDKMTMKSIMKISKTYQKENDIVWNFTKFLVDREGNVVKRFEPVTKIDVIEEELKKII